MHPAAKRLQERLRKLSEEAGAADEFSDSEVGEARTTVGVVNVKKCLLSPSLVDQEEFDCTLDRRVESGTLPSPHLLHQPTNLLRFGQVQLWYSYNLDAVCAFISAPLPPNELVYLKHMLRPLKL